MNGSHFGGAGTKVPERVYACITNYPQSPRSWQQNASNTVGEGLPLPHITTNFVMRDVFYCRSCILNCPQSPRSWQQNASNAVGADSISARTLQTSLTLEEVAVVRLTERAVNHTSLFRKPTCFQVLLPRYLTTAISNKKFSICKKVLSNS